MGVREALLQQGREMYRKEVRKELLEQGREMYRKEVRKELLEEGRAEGKAEAVIDLLRTQQFTIAEIANFFNVTEAFVRKMKKEKK